MLWSAGERKALEEEWSVEEKTALEEWPAEGKTASEEWSAEGKKVLVLVWSVEGKTAFGWSVGGRMSSEGEVCEWSEG